MEDLLEIQDTRNPLNEYPFAKERENTQNRSKALQKKILSETLLQKNIQSLLGKDPLSITEEFPSIEKFFKILEERKETLLPLSPELLWDELKKIATEAHLLHLIFFEQGTFDRIKKSFEDFYGRELTTAELYQYIVRKIQNIAETPSLDIKPALHFLHNLAPFDKIQQNKIAKKFLQILNEKKDELLKLKTEQLWNELHKIASETGLTHLPFFAQNSFEDLKKHFETLSGKGMTSNTLYNYITTYVGTFISPLILEK